MVAFLELSGLVLLEKSNFHILFESAVAIARAFAATGSPLFTLLTSNHTPFPLWRGPLHIVDTIKARAAWQAFPPAQQPSPLLLSHSEFGFEGGDCKVWPAV